MKKEETLVEQLTNILVKNNVIAEDKAKAIKKVFKDRSKPVFVNFLLEEDLVPRNEILNALAEYYKVPAFDVVGHFFDHFLLRKFPEDTLIRNVMIPLEVDENMLIVIASQPDNPELLSIIGDSVSYDVRFMVGIDQDIIDAIREFYDLSPSQVPEDEDIRREHIERGEAEHTLLEEGEEFREFEEEEEEFEEER
jgi:hypothetical protein